MVMAINKGAISVAENTQNKMDPMPSSSFSLGFVALKALDWA
jgi:hypothetical protein